MSLKPSRGLLTLAFVLIGTLLAAPAHAAPAIGGAADARLLIGLDGRYGAALSADLWYAPTRLKIGGAFAAAAISSGDGLSSRIVTPVGLSLACEPARDLPGLTLAGRFGVAPGARKGGFMWGAWTSAAIGYRFALGEGASVRLGADLWGLFGNGGGLFIAPYVGLGF